MFLWWIYGLECVVGVDVEGFVYWFVLIFDVVDNFVCVWFVIEYLFVVIVIIDDGVDIGVKG